MGWDKRPPMSFLNVIMNPVFTDADFQLQLPDGVWILSPNSPLPGRQENE